MNELISNQVRVYTPSGVVLPESLKLERTYPPHYAKQEDVRRKRLKLREADTRTLLHDIFRSPDGRKLHAIGPEPRNLLEELWPLTITVDGEQLRYRQRLEGVNGYRGYNKTRLLFLEADLPSSSAQRAELEVQLNWRKFTATAAVNPALRPPTTKPLLTLMAIQKNNHLEHIRDWCLYNHRVHKVERIVLYDNGSDDFDALRAELERLDDGLQVVLVRWNYPFGLKRFNYCQHAALNHCRSQFEHYASHFLNFDVDEYLVNASGMPLAEYLKHNLRGSVVALTASQYVVPNLSSGAPAAGPLRAHHFKHRMRRLETGAPKSIFTARNVTYVGLHRPNPAIPRWLEVLMPRWFKRLSEQRPKVWRMVASPPLGRFPYWFSRTMRRVPPSELYFNHYKGLNTGWKLDHARLERPDPAVHEPDPMVPALLERARLAEDGAE